jgi:poly-gamma-glutamate capsule biosynthesis protein CapA/YwtB (metallophosphatase superfamily)
VSANILRTHLPIHKQRTPLVRCFALTLLVSLLCSASAYEPSVNLVFLGDLMLGRGVAEAHAQGDWDSTLRSLHPLTGSADLALANLESPIGCDSSASAGPRSLAAPPEAVAALSSAGMDILSTVNNHSLDAGEEGVKCTREILASRGIRTLSASSLPLEFKVKGIEILFLAVDFTNDVSPAAWANLERILREADKAGKIIVISLHWGMEYQSGRDALQLRIARTLADSHADILWGHHPHVVQKMEWMGKTLVLYSLGNAVFDQQEPESVRRGELAWVEIDRRGVRRVWIVPFSIDPRLGKTNPPDLFSVRAADAPSVPAQDIITGDQP